MIEFEEYIKNDLIKNKTKLETELANINETLKLIDDPNIIPYYIVNIISYWKNDMFTEDEKDVRLRGRRFDKVLEGAIKRFKKINNRPDIQGKIKVHVEIDGLKIYIPPDNYKEILKNIND